MATPIIRAVSESNVASVLAMRQALCEEDGVGAADPVAAGEALRLLMNHPEYGATRIITEDGTPVGYFVVTFGFSLEFHGRDAFLDELYVIPSRRGRGLGQRAIAYAEQICLEQGVSALHLEVERANTRAQALYRRTGFLDHDRYLLTKWLRR